MLYLKVKLVYATLNACVSLDFDSWPPKSPWRLIKGSAMDNAQRRLEALRYTFWAEAVLMWVLQTTAVHWTKEYVHPSPWAALPKSIIFHEASRVWILFSEQKVIKKANKDIFWADSCLLALSLLSLPCLLFAFFLSKVNKSWSYRVKHDLVMKLEHFLVCWLPQVR